MKKTLTGVVKSDKMMKTAVVVVARTKTHPKYLKRTKVTKSFKVDNQIKAKIGDRVILEETRPMSRTKNFKITKIIKA